MVEDVGKNAHVQHCIPHGVADGVLARDDADGVERHAFERRAVTRAVVVRYGAKSWGCERRVSARIEASTMGLDIRCVVTNLETGSAE